ncbi:ABC transporter substrate-binding protein [Streptomyces sp. SL13]|jgi:peptide/nickel transport system substrate-binding protein|uniref:ABC transporter substrate-binding protein n=1 Tax=Streptantibioticus silvisoli TaxID=2705255 RepID=A0AA90HEM3_9ACTN|nr:ABC transporter substrate-binding protein [Streptantibioticus silvisoli]MDI5967599.1 ABC transporter substrate-binding protein [Streptantibioticus silvisoli]MDI5974285.1 ABC transporter substrate-binding protein [Streptantibioticus silvisoli]
MNRKLLALPAVVAMIAPVLTACGGSSGDSATGGATIVVGTTDQIVATKDEEAPLDPAASYDIAGWNVLGNVFQTLLSYPRTGTTPVPDAASHCGFTDRASETYACDLRPGLQFSNGDPLTSSDVKFSVDRQIAIADPNGPSSLLDNVDRVETQGASRVVFQLKTPDTTFPFKLATPAAAIVDHQVYPAKKTYTGYRLVGSGPYSLTSWKAGDQAVFTANSHYKGAFTINNARIDLRFFKDSAAMVAALKAGSIDLTNRTMTPQEIAGFQDNTSDKYDLVEAPGAEIRYLVFNMKDPTVSQLAVRKAVAQVVDRQALVRDVYARTSVPLYSMVPQGIVGHTNSFFDLYHDPSVTAARQTLQAAHITLPVTLHMSYTTDHYGESTAAEFSELQRQLQASGLFKVTLKGVPWSTYDPDVIKGDYSVYGMGWFPDFPDPDSYLGPFFGKDTFLGNSYDNATIEKQIIPAERKVANRGSLTADFEQAQQIIAEQIPFLPLWQGRQYLAAKSDITGTEWALNASSQMQFWELGRGVSQ